VTNVSVIGVTRKELVILAAAAGRSEIVARQLLARPPEMFRAPLVGIPEMAPGSVHPFADLASGPDGTISIAREGDGSIFRPPASPRWRPQSNEFECLLRIAESLEPPCATGILVSRNDIGRGPRSIRQVTGEEDDIEWLL
jgi:hypothetical protein